MNDEPRTIMRDLLEFAQDHEWVMEYVRCGHSCCGKFEHHCLSCGNEQKDGHDPGCRLASTIKKAESLLTAQDRRERLGWEPLDDDQRADQLNANLDDILGP